MLPAAACLVAGTALAVPVTDYLTVQPIDVCPGIAGSTAGCAPINNLSPAQGGNNYATAAVGNIGSIDVTPSGNRPSRNSPGSPATRRLPARRPRH